MRARPPDLFDGDPNVGKPATLDREALREIIAELVPKIVEDVVSLNMEMMFESLCQEIMTNEDCATLSHNLKRVYDRQTPRRQSRHRAPTLLPIRKQVRHDHDA